MFPAVIGARIIITEEPEIKKKNGKGYLFRIK
jgi:hypothetical protein